jgi:hypothetical protein
VYEDGWLLGCSAMQTGVSLITFQRSVLLPSQSHHPDDGGSTDLRIIVNLHQSTWRYNLEDSHFHILILLKQETLPPSELIFVSYSMFSVDCWFNMINLS